MKKRVLNIDKTSMGIFCVVCSEIINGFTFFFTKTAVDASTMFSLLSWRFSLAFIAMTLLAKLKLIPIHLKGKDLRPLLWIALFSPVIFFIAETIGISLTSTSESGVILACIPVASLVASTIVLKEKPSKNQIHGIILTLLGVIITVAAAGMKISFSPPGYFCLMICVVSYALYSVRVASARHFSGPEVTYMMLLCGMIVFDAFALIEAGIHQNFHVLFTLPFVSRPFLISVLFLSLIGSVLNFMMCVTAIDYIGVNRAVTFIGVSTTVSILAGILLLHEPFNKVQAIGSLVILIGVYTANLQSPPITAGPPEK